jgi:hypothetical protein
MAVASLAEARSHNVPPEVFLRHYREIRDCKSAHADTGMAVARAKKAAKGAGIDLDALKLLERLADLDTDEAEMQLRHLRTYAVWINLPIGSQLALFGGQAAPVAADAKAAAEHQEWAAGDAGAAAGRKGDERDTNPHDAGSAERAAWSRAWAGGHKTWLAGQTKLAGEMGRDADNGAEAPPRRPRGRPKKTAALAHEAPAELL